MRLVCPARGKSPQIFLANRFERKCESQNLSSWRYGTQWIQGCVGIIFHFNICMVVRYLGMRSQGAAIRLLVYGVQGRREISP